MVLVTLVTMAMDSDTPTARGLLMLSLRLRLILTMDTVLDTDTVSDTDTALDTPDTSDMQDTVDTTTASRLHQLLSVNQQLEFRQKNGLLSVLSSLHQCCSFSATILSL